MTAVAAGCEAVGCPTPGAVEPAAVLVAGGIATVNTRVLVEVPGAGCWCACGMLGLEPACTGRGAVASGFAAAGADVDVELVLAVFVCEPTIAGTLPAPATGAGGIAPVNTFELAALVVGFAVKSFEVETPLAVVVMLVDAGFPGSLVGVIALLVFVVVKATAYGTAGVTGTRTGVWAAVVLGCPPTAVSVDGSVAVPTAGTEVGSPTEAAAPGADPGKRGVEPTTVCVALGRVTGTPGCTGWRMIVAGTMLAGAVVVDFRAAPEATDDGAGAGTAARPGPATGEEGMGMRGAATVAGGALSAGTLGRATGGGILTGAWATGRLGGRTVGAMGAGAAGRAVITAGGGAWGAGTDEGGAAIRATGGGSAGRTVAAGAMACGIAGRAITAGGGVTVGARGGATVGGGAAIRGAGAGATGRATGAGAGVGFAGAALAGGESSFLVAA